MVNRPNRKRGKSQKRANKNKRQSLKKQKKQKTRVNKRKSKRGGMEPSSILKKSGPESSTKSVRFTGKNTVAYISDFDPFNITVYKKDDVYLVPLIHDPSHNSSTGMSYYNLNNTETKTYPELKSPSFSGTVLFENKSGLISVKIRFNDVKYHEFILTNNNIICNLDLIDGGQNQIKKKVNKCDKHEQEKARKAADAAAAEAAPQADAAAAEAAEETGFGFNPDNTIYGFNPE